MEMRSKLGQIVSSVWWRKCNLRRKIKFACSKGAAVFSIRVALSKFQSYSKTMSVCVGCLCNR
jgi:hypothetical protein